jgi:hypothetical protein
MGHEGNGEGFQIKILAAWFSLLVREERGRGWVGGVRESLLGRRVLGAIQELTNPPFGLALHCSLSS